MNQDTASEKDIFSTNNLAPFLYHKRVKNYFKERKKTWDWFAAQDNKHQQIETFKTNLLKNTYRLEAQTHKNLYDLVAEICTILNIDAQVTLYQEHNSLELNASISVFENEAHIVFSGSVISLLNLEEMKALLAHELCHYLFYKIENEDFEVCQRIVLALANNQESENAMIETARIFQLYLELFCDAGALKVCGNYAPVVQMLVKLNTSLHEVNAESYINQAKEIVLNEQKATQNETHPESYIRSLALYNAHQKTANFQDIIENLIEGNLDLNTLDIFNQKELMSLSIDFIQLILKPNWMKTSKILNLSERYFEHHFNEVNKSAEEISLVFENCNESVRKYFSYVLLDFAKVDSDMENLAMGHCFELAEILNLKTQFENLIKKEFKLNARDFKSLQENVIIETAKMKESKDESLYNN